jgi:hypothetical protein
MSIAVASEMSATSTAAAGCKFNCVTADATAVNATAAAAHNSTHHHHPSPPTLQTAIIASGNTVEAAETTSKRDAVSSVISSAAKISLFVFISKELLGPLTRHCPGAQSSHVVRWGYRDGVLSRKIAGSTSANKLQEGEIHEYAGFNPSQPVRSRREDT